MISIAEARSCYEAEAASPSTASVPDSAHDFDHALRVMRLAERIGAAEGADIPIVRAAALLHDVGRSMARREGRDHAEVGAEMARRILAAHDSSDVEAVAQAIAAHRFRSGPEPATIEARVLFDADKLDAIGAIGVARAFACAGARGQPLWAPDQRPPSSHPMPDEEHWRAGTGAAGGDPRQGTPVQEFTAKLVHLSGRLHTETARRIAEGRHAFMVAFFERLEAEAVGDL